MNDSTENKERDDQIRATYDQLTAIDITVETIIAELVRLKSLSVDPAQIAKINEALANAHRIRIHGNPG